MQRKLGKATDQRMALLQNQVSYLLWNGKLETTFARAKEVQKLAEKYLTLAINSYSDTIKITKNKVVQGKQTQVEVVNDGPKKLAARRTLMSKLSSLKETRQLKESKAAYKVRTGVVKHPLMEKMFNEYAPRFAERNSQSGQAGGYTSVHALGPRKGDAAEMALLVIL